MTQYNLIQNGESGLSVRTTLNDVITSANSGFTSVYYQIDTNTLPLSGKSGDVLLITNDGTSTGTVSQELIYDGSQWKDVLSSQTGSTSGNISYTTFVPVEGTRQQLSAAGIEGSKVNSVFIDPTTKKILAVGSFSGYAGFSAVNIVVINPSGSKNAQFPTSFGFSNETLVVKSNLNQDIFVSVAGTTPGTYSGTTIKSLVKLAPTGATLNTTFNTNFPSNAKLIQDFDFQSDGKIVWVGSDGGSPRIGRVNADGTADTTFNVGTGFNNSVLAVTILPDQKILVGGAFTQYNGTPINRICRLNPDGSLDTTFNVGTGGVGQINEIKLQSDGKIIVGQSASAVYNGYTTNGLFRLNTDGSVDTTFVKPFASTAFSSIAIDHLDRIYAYVFNTSIATNVPRTGVVRYNKNGVVDLTYRDSTSNQMNSAIQSIAADNGYIIVGGSFPSVDYQPNSGYLTKFVHDVLPLGNDGDRVISSQNANFNSEIGRIWTYDSTNGWIQTSSEVLAERYSGPVKWQNSISNALTPYITATTTTPTSFGNGIIDNIYYVRNISDKEIEVIIKFTTTSGISADTGTGDYLISLPSGLKFDTTLPFQQPYTLSVGASNTDFVRYTLPSSYGTGLVTTTSLIIQPIKPIIYDDTRFRLLMNTSTSPSSMRCWGSTNIANTPNPLTFNLTFRAQVL